MTNEPMGRSDYRFTLVTRLSCGIVSAKTEVSGERNAESLEVVRRLRARERNDHRCIRGAERSPDGLHLAAERPDVQGGRGIQQGASESPDRALPLRHH